MHRIIRIYGLMLLLALSMGVRAQDSKDTIDRSAPDFVTVSLVVCEPSDVLYSTLGHAALHLQCPTFDLDYFFSYEGENVRDKIWTFLKGDLKMGMFALPPSVFLSDYEAEGRGVSEYTLNLTPAQKQRLWEVMDKHVEEGAFMPYDYFHRGCAKSVVQVMHEAIGKRTIRYAPWPDKYTQQTQREIVRNFITDAPWEEFFMYFLIGSEGDKEYPCEQKLIVPTDLVEVWQKATIDGETPFLDSTERVLVPSTRSKPAIWFTPLLVSILLLILSIGSLAAVWITNRTYQIIGLATDILLYSVYVLIGGIMTYLIVFSGLPCTSWNWLLIPFNILPVMAWYWRRYWALPGAGLMLVWCLVMIGEWCWGHVIVDWPHILLALATGILPLTKIYLKAKKS